MISRGDHLQRLSGSAARQPSGGAVLSRLFGRLFPLIFSLCYATILASLPVDAFVDRDNYLRGVKTSEAFLALTASRGWMTVLANEPIWFTINVILKNYFSPDEAVRILIYIPAFIVPFTILRNNNKHALWLTFFLLAPQVMKNHVIHLRQGFGLSVFLIGYYAKPKWIRVTVMGASGFIHASFLIINAVGIAVEVARTIRFSPGLRIAIFAISFPVIGLLLHSIAGALGARQGGEYGIELDASGLGFLFWSSILVLMISAGSHFIRDHIFPLSVTLFYLSSYFFTPVSARIFESIILLVLLAGLSLRGWRRQAFLFSVVLYFLITLLLRIGQPWLGWGVS